jgi:hypothetical protein
MQYKGAITIIVNLKQPEEGNTIEIFCDESMRPYLRSIFLSMLNKIMEAEVKRPVKNLGIEGENQDGERTDPRSGPGSSEAQSSSKTTTGPTGPTEADDPDPFTTWTLVDPEG